jgi:hypothetical protein
MAETNKQAGSVLIQWSAIIGLGILNLIIFRSHYFGKDCFPWDFWKTYYTIIPFWTVSLAGLLLYLGLLAIFYRDRRTQKQMLDS